MYYTLSLAKAKMLATNQDQRDYFESHTSDYTNPSGHTLFNGRARYEAWATYLDDPNLMELVVVHQYLLLHFLTMILIK